MGASGAGWPFLSMGVSTPKNCRFMDGSCPRLIVPGTDHQPLLSSNVTLMSSELSPLQARGAPPSSKSNVTLAYCIHSRAMRATRSCALRVPAWKQTLMVSPRLQVRERTTTPRTWPSDGPLISAGMRRAWARAAGSVEAMQEGWLEAASAGHWLPRRWRRSPEPRRRRQLQDA